MATIPETLANAVQHHQAGQLQAAEPLYRQVLRWDASVADAWHLLGVLNVQLGRHGEGVDLYRRAIALRPGWAEALFNLGWALREQGNLDEAAACLRRTLELKPEYVEAHDTLGVVLQEQGKLDEALACHHRALELNPDCAAAHNNLGMHLLAQGNVDEAVACYRRAFELNPDVARAHSAWLWTLQYRGSVTLQELAAAHAAFEHKHAAPLRSAWRPHPNVRDPERRLRLGFLSPDLRRHPVGYFLIRLLENLDRGQFAATCYQDSPAGDDLTARLRAAAAAWTDVPGQTDAQLAEQVRTDGIDILFDLAGHTRGNRLLVFARKPAPVQITWIGYEGTTGLEAMDYLLADRYEIPPESAGYYRERVLRMPEGYLCYDPPGDAPPVSPLPALEEGCVTFAAFHNPPKITPRVVAVWARILKRLPQSRLTLKYRWMDKPLVADRFADLFAAEGIDKARLEFAPPGDYPEYYAAYREVDIALDPFPFGGGITTCDALWMGVPVVTCPGETFASRHGLSHLSNIGLTETIAGDSDEYVEIAAALAGDLPRLAALRAGLRERMAASPLCDGKRFAENFAEIVRGAWRRWCEEGN